MTFRAIFSTEDRRITKGKIYFGSIVHLGTTPNGISKGFRIIVFDNTGNWMTFAMSAFQPAELAAP